MERHFLFSLFLDLFQPIFAWNEATMVFFDFLEFRYLFLEFSFTRPVGREQKQNFYFSLSRPFPTYFGLKWSHNGIFLIFWIFFLKFCITRQLRTKQNDNFYFLSFSAFPNFFLLEKKPQWCFLNFFNFFAFFLLNFLLRVW